MQQRFQCRNQSGAALAISLIILLILTIVVLSSNQSTLVQEKMSAAVREGHVTLSLAESGIAEAEVYLDGLTEVDFVNDFNAAGAGGLYSEGEGPDDIFAPDVWAAAQTTNVTIDLPDNTTVDVQYFIQSLGRAGSGPATNNINVINYGEGFEAEGSDIFRIVARSTGTKNNAERVVVTYFGKNF